MSEPMSFFHRTTGGLALVVAAAGPLTGCGSLLDVELPTRVPAETLNNPLLAAHPAVTFSAKWQADQ